MQGVWCEGSRVYDVGCKGAGCMVQSLGSRGSIRRLRYFVQATQGPSWEIQNATFRSVVQGCLAHKKTPPYPGPPSGPRRSPTVGS